MADMSQIRHFTGTDITNVETKRKRENDENIPRPFGRSGGDMMKNGAATGANAIGVKKLRTESL
jgi:hypothetical protein